MFAQIICISVRDHAPYMGTDGFPEVSVIAQDLYLKKDVIEFNLHIKGNVRGFPSKFLFEKVTLFANSGSWDAFYVVFTLLIYGLVLFPNIEEFIDKVVVTIFVSKNPVITLLAEVLFSFHWRNQKRDGMINFCIPFLYKWILTHFPRKSPFVDNIGALKWSQRLMYLVADDIIWYFRDYDGVDPIYSGGYFQNVRLISARDGVINYNPIISFRQLGYLLKEKPEDKLLEDFTIVEGSRILI